MNAYADSGSRTDARASRHAPAYGPVDAVLGYALFYLVVDRATSTITTTFADVLSVSPSLVGLGLAAALWFVLVVTAVDQLRRQLAALGVVTHEAVSRDAGRPATLSETRALGYLAALLVGGVVAVWTFASAMPTAVDTIRVVATLDASAFDVEEFAVMAIFFVAYGVATHALDRLVVSGVRTMLAE